jgi:hypothetical protein
MRVAVGRGGAHHATGGGGCRGDRGPRRSRGQAASAGGRGHDLGVRSPRWLFRFGDATRLAERYRTGRVLLAGAAAHVHPPAGGQGPASGPRTRSAWAGDRPTRSTGGPEGLLDSDHSERHPVAADVLTTARATAEVNQYLIGEVTEIGVRYDVGEGHRRDGPSPTGRATAARAPVRADARWPWTPAGPDRTGPDRTGPDRLPVAGCADRVDHAVGRRCQSWRWTPRWGALMSPVPGVPPANP